MTKRQQRGTSKKALKRRTNRFRQKLQKTDDQAVTQLQQELTKLQAQVWRTQNAHADTAHSKAAKHQQQKDTSASQPGRNPKKAGPPTRMVQVSSGEEPPANWFPLEKAHPMLKTTPVPHSPVKCWTTPDGQIWTREFTATVPKEMRQAWASARNWVETRTSFTTR